MRRELKFRAFDKSLQKIYPVLDLNFDGDQIIMKWEGSAVSDDLFRENEEVELMQFTGFKDQNEVDIYEGDILSDWTETDEGPLESKMQVFWNEPTGSWHLDNSSEQDKTYSTELWLELNDFKYSVTGNIYESKS